MKKIFIAFIAAACMLSSCSDDKTDEGASKGRISISGEGVINAGPDGVQKDITVTSSGDWRLAGVSDWVHPSATSGKNGDVVTFTVDPNASGASREVIFKFFTGAAVAPLKIMSLQAVELTLVSEQEMNVKPLATDIYVKLITNIPELTCAFSDGAEEWISFKERSDVFGNTVLSFSVDENAAYDNRSTVLTITGEGRSLDVVINQLQTDVIVLANTLYEIGGEGGSINVDLSTNIDYKIEIPEKVASWIHHVAPKGATRGLASRTEIFAIDPAPGLRIGKIYFTKADNSYSQEITIRQNGSEHIYANFSDPVFRTWLEENGYAIGIEGTKCELTYDGINATSFNLNGSKVKSVEGIDAFTNLTSLICNLATSLEKIPLGDLPITSIAMNNNSNLRTNVVVSGTQLTSFSTNYSMYVPTVDVSGCPVLTKLDIGDCWYLSTLYLKTGQTIPTIIDTYTGYYVPGGKYVTVYK